MLQPKIYGCRFDLTCHSLHLKNLGFNSCYTIVLKGTSKNIISIDDFTNTIKVVLPDDNCYFGVVADFVQSVASEELSWELTLVAEITALKKIQRPLFNVQTTLASVLQMLTPQGEINCAAHQISYATSYGNSLYNYFSRLCTKYGVNFFYRRKDSQTKLIITDKLATYDSYQLTYAPAQGLTTTPQEITALKHQTFMLPESLGLSGYNELDYNKVYKAQSYIKTSLKGCGKIEFIASFNINSAKDCDFFVKLFQEQLDWQREQIQFRTINTTIQVADLVTIHNHLVVSGTWRVINTEIIYNKQDFHLQVWAIKANTPYRPLNKISQYKYPKENLPDCLSQTYLKPIPVLLPATTTEHRNDQGLYPVTFVDDPQGKVIYMRAIQLSAGTPQTNSYGFDVSIEPQSPVIIAHLEDEIDKPFVLGVNEQACEIRLKKYNATLEFNEEARTLNLAVASKQTLSLDATKNISKLASENDIALLAQEDLTFSAGQKNINTNEFAITARDEFKLTSAKSIANTGSQAITLKAQEIVSDSSKFISQTRKQTTFRSEEFLLDANSLEIMGVKFTLTATNSLDISAQQLALRENFMLAENEINLAATKIKFDTPNLNIYKSGNFNSGLSAKRSTEGFKPFDNSITLQLFQMATSCAPHILRYDSSPAPSDIITNNNSPEILDEPEIEDYEKFMDITNFVKLSKPTIVTNKLSEDSSGNY